MTALGPGAALDRALEILRRQPIVDGHNDLPWAAREVADYDLDVLNLHDTAEATHTDLRRLRAGHVGAQFWSVWVPTDLADDGALVATLEQIDFVHQMIAAYPDDLALAVAADDVVLAQSDGRIACLIGAEGGHSIGNSLGALRTLHMLGVRYLTLTHNRNVPWADSATDEPAVHGLTRFGREVIAEMNRIGMLVDLSHVSTDTMNAALDVTEAPVIFSHSSCRALVDHPRNVPDDVLLRLRDNGGLCMVSFVPEFVSADCHAWETRLEDHLRHQGISGGTRSTREAARQEFIARDPAPRATLSQVADHLEHAREILGVEGIGIGGDYDGSPDFPEDLPDVSGYPALFAELVARGWSDAECELVAGGNVLRVMRAAQEVAERLGPERRPSRMRILD
jgi:membrane dipeptidase